MRTEHSAKVLRVPVECILISTSVHSWTLYVVADGMSFAARCNTNHVKLKFTVLLLLLLVEVELQSTALLSSKQFRLKILNPMESRLINFSLHLRDKSVVFKDSSLNYAFGCVGDDLRITLMSFSTPACSNLQDCKCQGYSTLMATLLPAKYLRKL